jgi:hypothetical protein
VGGVVGGVAAISIAVAVIFYLRRRRRRSRARSAATPGVGASQPPVDETKQPLTEEGANTGSSLPGTSSMPGTPGAPMRLYVRVFFFSFAILRAPVCAHRNFFIYIHRTRMIQLRSLGTKGLCHRPPLKDPCRHTTRPETPCRPPGHRDITVCLLSDSLMNHRSHRSDVHHLYHYLIPLPFLKLFVMASQGQNCLIGI